MTNIYVLIAAAITTAIYCHKKKQQRTPEISSPLPPEMEDNPLYEPTYNGLDTHLEVKKNVIQWKTNAATPHYNQQVVPDSYTFDRRLCQPEHFQTDIQIFQLTMGQIPLLAVGQVLVPLLAVGHMLPLAVVCASSS